MVEVIQGLPPSVEAPLSFSTEVGYVRHNVGVADLGASQSLGNHAHHVCTAEPPFENRLDSVGCLAEPPVAEARHDGTLRSGEAFL
eukprot:6829129-Pyramimonas_sp.AAC.1